MHVHRMRTRKEFAEIVCTNRDHHRQANRRPDRIAAANPIPEAKDAFFANAECCNLIKGCGNGCKMCANGVFAQCIGDPFARGLRIGHGFDGGEGFGSDDDERRCRIKRIQRVGNVCAVDVRDIMRTWAIVVRRKCDRCHDRTEIRAADTDIDDVGDLLAGRTLDRA
ncbi:hypothetical protein FQZ97_1033450 [compost metagenome]